MRIPSRRATMPTSQGAAVQRARERPDRGNVARDRSERGIEDEFHERKPKEVARAGSLCHDHVDFAMPSVRSAPFVRNENMRELPVRSQLMHTHKFLTLVTVILLAACGASEPIAPPNPDAQWIGTWSLVTDNGVTVPADITIATYPARVTSRSLVLLSSHSGIWQDSSAMLCPGATPSSGKLCTASGSATITWSAVGDTLTVLALSVNGYVVPVKTFAHQGDGSLRKTDDSQIEIYRRR